MAHDTLVDEPLSTPSRPPLHTANRLNTIRFRPSPFRINIEQSPPARSWQPSAGSAVLRALSPNRIQTADVRYPRQQDSNPPLYRQPSETQQVSSFEASLNDGHTTDDMTSADASQLHSYSNHHTNNDNAGMSTQQLQRALFDAYVYSDGHVSHEQEIGRVMNLTRKSDANNLEKFDYAIVLISEKQVRGSVIARVNDGLTNTLQSVMGGTPVQMPASPITTSADDTVITPRTARMNNPHQLQNPFTMKKLRKQKQIDFVSQLLVRCQNAGLTVEQERLKSHNGETLMKLSAPNERMEYEAERMRLRMRLKVGGYCAFDRSIREEFVGTADAHCIFRSSERQQILEHILKSPHTIDTTHASPNEQHYVGVGIREFDTFIIQRFPLHMHARLMGLASWYQFFTIAYTAKWHIPYITHVFTQPLDDIATYFGEHTAFYFAFIGFYTKHLMFPAVIGVILAIVQWQSNAADSGFLPIFCLCISVWSTVLVFAWQRQTSQLAYKWGVYHYEIQDERLRPDYRGTLQRNSLTGEMEMVYPAYKRRLKLLVSLPVLMIVAASLATLMITLFAWRDRQHPTVNVDSSATSTTLTAHAAQLVAPEVIAIPLVWGFVIPVINILFTRAAKRLTDWENWKTESLYHRHVVLKIFSFRFLNSFLPLYYYAFVDVDLTRLSLSVLSFLVAGQLFRFAVNILLPIARRRWRTYCLERDAARQQEASRLDNVYSTTSTASMSAAERVSLRLQQISTSIKRSVTLPTMSAAWLEATWPQNDNFEDYANTVIQIGYVSFFSVAFPLAPLLAMINNLIVIRAGAHKLCCVTQRPLSRKSGGIGIWLDVLKAMSLISVLTNCALVGLTSQQLNVWFPNLTRTDKMLLTFVFEHCLLALVLVIKLCTHSTPRAIRQQLRRDKWELDRIRARLLQVDRKARLEMLMEDDANLLEAEAIG